MLHGWVDREGKTDVQETLAIRCRRMDRIFNFVERRPSRYDRIDKRIRENWYRHSEMKMDPETRQNTGGQNAALLRKLNLPTGLMKIVWFDKYAGPYDVGKHAIYNRPCQRIHFALFVVLRLNIARTSPDLCMVAEAGSRCYLAQRSSRLCVLVDRMMIAMIA